MERMRRRLAGVTEVGEKQARSIKYQLNIAKLPVANAASSCG